MFLLKLLTIAIPTYNRAELLDLCLAKLSKQIEGCEEVLELLVSNNNSTDTTQEVVAKYIGMGVPIKYVENAENMGAERNVIQCYTLASSKYLLVIGDDDVLLDGSLQKILNILKGDSYGVVYLSGYGFTADHQKERPINKTERVLVFDDKKQFIAKVHFFLTFLSGNIVNKELVKNDIDPNEFLGTNLPQLAWTLAALFKAEKNVFCNEYMIAAKSENRGGFGLCEVFGDNLNRIFDRFVANGVDRNFFSIINQRLIQVFFPTLILDVRTCSGKNDYSKENYFIRLKELYSRYLSFWLVVLPVIYLPIAVARGWYATARLWMIIFNKALSIGQGVRL